MESDQQRRQTLAQFLRIRRNRVTPEAVGLPPGSHRRLGGLRREEVAILAGVSPTWYTYLEQGRKIQPSPEVLDSLARVLQLSEDERRYVHSLAYGQVVQLAPLAGEIPAEDLIVQAVAALGDGPFPVYALNLCCDLIAWNKAATEWYDDWYRLPPSERNMMHWMMISPKARERLCDWESDARDIVARWRSMTVGFLNDPRLQRRITDLSQQSEQFTQWWGEQEIQEHRSRTRRFRHPRLGIQTVRLLVVAAPEITPGFITLHLPAQSVAMP